MHRAGTMKCKVTWRVREGGLVHINCLSEPRVTDAGGLGWRLRSVFLANSQVALRLLVWGPHFEKHYLRELRSGTKLFQVLLVKVWDQQLPSKAKSRLTLHLFFLFSGFAAVAAGDSPSAAHEPGGDVCLIYESWRTLRD